LLYKYYKEEASVVTHFWALTQKRENTKKYIYSKEIQKIIVVRRGFRSAKKLPKIG